MTQTINFSYEIAEFKPTGIKHFAGCCISEYYRVRKETRQNDNSIEDQ